MIKAELQAYKEELIESIYIVLLNNNTKFTKKIKKLIKKSIKKITKISKKQKIVTLHLEDE